MYRAHDELEITEFTESFGTSTQNRGRAPHQPTIQTTNQINFCGDFPQPCIPQCAHTAPETVGLGRAGRPARSTTTALARRYMASIPTQGRLRCPHPPAGGAVLGQNLSSSLVAGPFAPPAPAGRDTQPRGRTPSPGLSPGPRAEGRGVGGNSAGLVQLRLKSANAGKQRPHALDEEPQRPLPAPSRNPPPSRSYSPRESSLQRTARPPIMRRRSNR